MRAFVVAAVDDEPGGATRRPHFGMARRGSKGRARSFFLAKQSENVVEYPNAHEVGDGPESERRKRHPYC